MSRDATSNPVFLPVVELSEISIGSAKGFIIEGWPVLIGRPSGEIYAVLDRCPHAAARLSAGRLRRGAISCPIHGALFDLSTGRCVGDHYRPLLTFPVRISNDIIEVAIPGHPPSPDQIAVSDL